MATDCATFIKGLRISRIKRILIVPCIPWPSVPKKRRSMKAMTREELAYRAGVDRKTFYRYIMRHKDELCAMGMRPRERLPPAVVKWIVDAYGVSIDDE